MQAETSPPASARGAAAFASTLPERMPWGPWSGLLLAVLIMAASIMGSLVLARSGLVALPGASPGDSIGLQVLLAQQTLAILLTLLVGLRARGPSAMFALTPPLGGAKTYAIAIGIVASFQAIVTTLEFTIVPNDMVRDLKPFVELSRGPLWLFGLVVVGIGAPLSEELLFRGLLMPALAQSRLGGVGAAVFSTGLWTGLHANYSVTGLIEVFATGLLFSWLLWKTGSLRVTILCHGLYNAAIILGLRYLPLPAVLGG